MIRNILNFSIFLIISSNSLCFASILEGTSRNLYRGVCPPSTISETWLYHNETNKCYPADEQGPCGEMMLFYKDPWNSEIGFCDCDDTLRDWEKSQIPEYCNWKRPRVYWPDQYRCYSAYHQGPCTIGQWLILDSNFQPKCETNYCNRNQDDDPNAISYWFTHNDNCYRTFTTGYCKNGRFLILNSDEGIQPQCSRYPNKYFSTVNLNDPTLDIKCPKPRKSNAKIISCREGRRIRAAKEICRRTKIKKITEFDYD